MNIMINKIYANTKGQQLDQHLFAVAYLARLIINELIPDDSNLADAVFVAGCWHDIGKIDPAFQDWLIKLIKNEKFEDVPDDGQHIDKKTGKFSWQKHPRHNEISLLFFHLFNDVKGINNDSVARAKHAIYWHHAKPLRDKNNEIKKMIGIFNKLEDLELNYIKYTESVIAILKSVKSIADEYLDDTPIEIDSLDIPKFDDIENDLEAEKLPEYKRYSEKENISKYQNNIQHNAKNNLARSALITADRLISKLTNDALVEHLNNRSLDQILEEVFKNESGLKQNIQQCLEGFNQNNPEVERNNQQAFAAKNLSDEEVEIGVLKGPAGCGKTKIALEWAFNTGVKKLFWVCPRVQICEGLFKDLQSSEYLPQTKLEICTGEIKQILQSGKPIDTPEGSEFSGDIVITTIDQIINSITTHRNIETFISFMAAHVVFDEYHEYINMPAFNLLFAELVECKKYQQYEDETLPNTLLVSATPNPLFVTKLLQIPELDIEGISSFNQSQYKIKFVDYDEKIEDDTNPLFQPQPANTIVISNTAITAQKSFIDNQDNENGILLHSKFTKIDREVLFDKTMNAFGKDGDRSIDVLRSGPVVQAALNITCDKMVSEITHAENFLQRLGRLGRFGENELNQYDIAITKDVKEGKATNNSASFLSSMRTLQTTKIWFEFLQNKLPDGTITINQIYELYDQFYKDESCQNTMEKDLVTAFKDSVRRIEKKLFDPVTSPSSKNTKNKIKKYSLRGDSRFVQMAVCKISNRQEAPTHLNKYLDDVMTYEVNRIEGVFMGQQKSDRDLIAFMYKKDHKIQTIKQNKKIKQKYSVNVIKNEARNPDFPIFISYTMDDINANNDKPNPYAIYYLLGKNNQPIGAISLKQLTKKVKI